jgi:mannitol/fructose-specific phosphotransferase system IIA component (Ntr-type)
MLETRFSAVLKEDDVRLDFWAPSLAEAAPALLTPALERAGIGARDRLVILEAIARREQETSTISPPLALPHARHESAPVIIAGLALNAGGALEGNEAVKAIVAFASPANAAAEHLRFLSGVVRLFRSADLLDELTAARTPAAVLAVLRARGN